MKLRALLGIGLVLAGALWLLLETRATRAGRPDARTQDERSPEPVTTPLLAAIQVPALATDEPEVAESPRIPLPPSPSPASPQSSPARTSSPSRGRLVDERTLEPIPDALVAARMSSARTDAQGWFDTGEPLGELEELQVMNVARNGSVKEVPRERWTKLAEGWLVPLAIGPTFRLRFAGLEQKAAGPWEGRVVQGDDAKRWLTLIDGPLPTLRYDEPITEHGGDLWVEVRSKDGLQEGRGEARSLIGVQEVDVACRSRAVLRGRVVDEEGSPCSEVQIEAVLLDPDATERLASTRGKDGSYQVSAAEPGTMVVVALATRSTRLRELRLPVPRGVTTAPDIVLARPAGTIRGSVRCRSGAGWIPVTVRLRALDGSGFEQETGVGLGSESALRRKYEREGIDMKNVGLGVPAQRTSGEFAFEDVPPGRFELSISTPQGFPCSPAALQITAPSDGLRFTCDDEVRLRSYRLRAVDAESRAALGRLHWLVRAGDAGSEPDVHPTSDGNLLELADGVGFEWWASAAGYCLAHGTERDFQPQGDEYAATCALRRGFGVRLVLQEWTGSHGFVLMGGRAKTRWSPGVLSGVVVVADGVEVATSDEQGLAELDLPAVPARIDLRLAGWHVVDSAWFRNGKVDPRFGAEPRCRMIRE